jgi:type IV pilus assembly protein PilO
MAASRNDRLWVAGGAAGALLVALLAWLLVINPELSNASSLRDQTNAAQTQNTVLQAKVRALQAEDANKVKLTEEMRQALNALPITNGIDDLTRQLSGHAAAALVKIKAITVGAPAPVTLTGGSATSSSSAPPGAAAGGATAGKLYSIAITLISEGSTPHQQAFLDRIQRIGPRRVLISSTQFAPGAAALTGSIESASTMTAQLQVFSSPQTPAQAEELARLLGNGSN